MEFPEYTDTPFAAPTKASVGNFVGVEKVGTLDGSIVAAVGSMVFALGATEGAILGPTVGCTEGVVLGPTDGCTVGNSLGTTDGASLGTSVGD